ncbi:hypothetical protein [Nonomuraea salmonea]|uniref:hypothetical protein n=1 Tax=Nonomuraea salmonea TaxID=46181 RepID=UPI0031F012B1
MWRGLACRTASRWETRYAPMSAAAAQAPAARVGGTAMNTPTTSSATPLTATSSPAAPSHDGTSDRKYPGTTKCATPVTPRKTARTAAITSMPRCSLPSVRRRLNETIALPTAG